MGHVGMGWGVNNNNNFLYSKLGFCTPSKIDFGWVKS